MGTNLPTYSDFLLKNKDSVWCVLTSSNTCVSSNNVASNKVITTVKANPTIGTSYLTKTTLCYVGDISIGNNTNTFLGGVWTSSNTNVATATNNAAAASSVITAVSNGTATLTYTKAPYMGCISRSSVVVTVAIVTPATFIGVPTQLCKGTAVSIAASIPGGVWASLTGSASVTSGGVVTGLANGGTSNITYTLSNTAGCTGVTTLAVPLNPIPAAPTINYAVGNTVNPQTGASPSGTYCNNRTFTLAGSPTGGVWSSTNTAVVTVNSSGVASTVGVGTGSVVYTVTNANGCSNSKSVIGKVVGCVPRGVNSAEFKIQNLKFNLYPNPARTFISLNVETLIGFGKLLITDYLGRAIKEQPLSMGMNIIDVSSFAKGMYFVTIITEQGKEVRKVVVE